MQVAHQQERIVVTLDADFHALLALAGASKPSVLRIRKQGLKAQQASAMIKQVLALTGDDLNRGAMVTVSDGTIRVKYLPITRESGSLQE